MHETEVHKQIQLVCEKTLVFVFGTISCGKNAVLSLQVDTCALCLHHSVVMNKTASTARLTISITISILAHK